MYIIHEQRQKSNFSIIVIYLLLAVLLLVALIFKELPKITKIVLVIVLVVDVLFFKFFYELKFRVTNEGLEFGFGFFKNKVTKDFIKSVLIDNSKGSFFGYGIRFNKNKTMGFIAKHGDGLKIVFKDDRSFFITIDRPQEALDIIKQNNYV